MPHADMLLTRAARELIIDALEIPDGMVVTYGTPVSPECWFSVTPRWASLHNGRSAQELVCMQFFVEHAVLRLYDNANPSVCNPDPCLFLKHHYDIPGAEREMAGIINKHLQRMKWAIDTWNSSRAAAQL